MSIFETYLISDLANIVLEYLLLDDRRTIGGDELRYDSVPLYEQIVLKCTNQHLLGRMKSITLRNIIPDIITSNVLQTLVMSTNTIAFPIIQCPNLEVLKLPINKLVPILPKLKKLTCEYIGNILQSMPPLQSMPLLRNLNITIWMRENSSIFDMSSNLTILTIKVSSCILQSIHSIHTLDRFAGILPKLKKLKIISIGDIICNLSTKNLEQIHIRGTKYDFTILPITLTHITIESADFPVDFTRFPNLVYLYLGDAFHHDIDLSNCPLITTLIVKGPQTVDISGLNLITMELREHGHLASELLTNIKSITSYVSEDICISGLLTLEHLIFRTHYRIADIILDNLPNLQHLEFQNLYMNLDLRRLPVSRITIKNNFNYAIIIPCLRKLDMDINDVKFSIDLGKTVAQNLEAFDELYNSDVYYKSRILQIGKFKSG